jgi:cytochrome P450
MGNKSVVDFDQHSERHAREGLSEEKQLRSECPVAWSSHHDGFWVVSTHKELTEGLRNHQVFTTTKGRTIPPLQPQGHRDLPGESDPPEWNGYRRILSPPFAPAAVDRMVPRIQDITRAVVDGVIEDGQTDLLLDIASPVTAFVTLDILGMPLRDWRIYSEPLHTIVWAPPESPEYAEAARALELIYHKVAEEVSSHRADPRDDLISYLLTAEIDGRLLSDAEVNDMVINLLFGGLDTTSNLLASTFVYLDDHRELHQRLVENDGLLATATEEFVRWVSPSLAIARTVTSSTQLGDQKLDAGQSCLFLYRSANRDTAMFKDPDDVDVERYPNRHVGFGVGIHRCLGSNLARVVFRTVLREVLSRMPDYRVDRSRAKPYPRLSIVNGYISVPISFSPGLRLGPPMEEILG